MKERKRKELLALLTIINITAIIAFVWALDYKINADKEATCLTNRHSIVNCILTEYFSEGRAYSSLNELAMTLPECPSGGTYIYIPEAEGTDMVRCTHEGHENYDKNFSE